MKTFPEDLAVADPHNWKFPKMSENETIACCCWEYARESAFLRDVQRHCAALMRRDPYKRQAFIKARQALEPDLQRIRAAGHLASLIAGEFWHRPEEQCYPRPWLSLTPSARQSRTPAEQPKPAAFGRAGSGYAEQIVQRAEEYVRTAPCPGPPGPLTKPEAWIIMPPSSFIQGGEEIGLFQIHWAGWNDDEITSQFKRWAEKNRPRCFRKPKGRPPGSLDWRAALRCLAIMRVMREHSAADVAHLFPTLYLSCKKKHFRDRERAQEIFEKLFAFGIDHSPLSAQTDK